MSELTMQNRTERPLLRLATAGSVDDGKSTLIGRLFYDCDNILDDQMAALKKASEQLGRPELDLSLFTDGLEAEREQGITIDVAYRYFETPKRRVIIADVPGHEQYTRNMVTGASQVDAVLVLVDATAGMTTQSKRHMFIASLLNVHHIAVIVNKMDAVHYSQDIFESIKKDFTNYASKLPVTDLKFIPTSALKGDMVVERGVHMPWHGGDTLLHYLENIPVHSNRNIIDFRLPIQNVVRDQAGVRYYAGTIESGILKNGELVMHLPSQRVTTVTDISLGQKSMPEAFSPQSVMVRLADDIDVSRGDMLVRKNNLPEVSNDIEAMLCWLDEKPMRVGSRYILKHTTNTVKGSVATIHYRIDINTLHRKTESQLQLNDVGRARLLLQAPILFDSYHQNKNTGSFILIDDLTKSTVAAGIILGKNAEQNMAAVPAASTGCVLWLTGLSGSGKSAIADVLYERLSSLGVPAERLDGDILRQNISRDLGYSKVDRDINIERAAWLAKYLSKHGVIVIASFISPYRSQRKFVKENVSNFVEIFANAPLEVCQQRDVKGLYKKARNKQIDNFTGVDHPYELPVSPDIELKTDKLSIGECVERLMAYLQKRSLI